VRIVAHNLEIHKFGGGIWGTSGEGITDIDDALDHEGKKIVVVSAFDGLTKKLRADEWEEVLKEYFAAEEYIEDRSDRELYDEKIREYGWRLKKGKSFISKAEILGLGELLSSELLHFHRRSLGKKTKKLDLNENFPIIAKNYKPEDADPDLAKSKTKKDLVEEAFREVDEVVVPGFLAYANDEQVVTLGEGGSDTTAYVLANMMNLREVILWKETEGIRTANPDIIPDARLVEYLTLSEGLNLALFGGKVLNHKGIKIGFDQRIAGKVKHIKSPHRVTNIVEKKYEPIEWANKLVKYVGGTQDALQVQVPYHMLPDFVGKIVENNLGDLTHIIGPVLYPQLIILDGQKVSKMELTQEERKVIETGRSVAVVNMVGDGLGPARHVLARSSKVISERASILGNITSTRNGNQLEGAYMSFAVEPGLFKETIGWLHEEFIEKDPSWE
jgi:aspartate kinase